MLNFFSPNLWARKTKNEKADRPSNWVCCTQAKQRQFIYVLMNSLIVKPFFEFDDFQATLKSTSTLNFRDNLVVNVQMQTPPFKWCLQFDLQACSTLFQLKTNDTWRKFVRKFQNAFESMKFIRVILTDWRNSLISIHA